MALTRCISLASSRCIRSGLLKKHGTLHRFPGTPVPINPEGLPIFRCLFYKSPGSTLDALRIWKLLEFLGMNYCSIVRFRRRMKRFSYPWLVYCIPTAFILGIGDFIAQYHLKPHAADRSFKKFLTDEWAVGETLLFALVGFFPTGFILSKWNLYLYRKLKCHGKLSFLLKKLLLDLLILSPIILTIIALAYGTAFDKNIFNESKEDIEEMIKKKYWPAVKESMAFNIMTRPVALFSIFYLAPIHLRRLFKTVYEVIFAAYVTDSIRRNVGGNTSTKKLSSSADKISTLGGGDKKKGFPCIAFDSTENLTEQPLSRWARYKRWACRNREN